MDLCLRMSATCLFMRKILILLSSMLFVNSATIPDNISPMAQTQQGIYVGCQVAVDNININYWYGIPYAQQPIDNLRWMPPQALVTSNSTKNASTPNACPQPNSNRIQTTESCLTLNIHTPENASNLPVYVWIHGGSFISGSGALFNPNLFIATSVIHSVPIIVVTINYRLGLLGFLADNALYNERSGNNGASTTGNYGILDQLMALDWIRKNIRNFGGDPEQITVGGESAGGISITVLLTSPLLANNTFQKAIIQSGNIWPDVVSFLQKAINTTGNVLRTAVNCTTVQCLRNVNVDRILRVQNSIMPITVFTPPVSPVIDGYVFNDMIENNYAAGHFQKVPVLVGSNTNETSFVTCTALTWVTNSMQVQQVLNSLYDAVIVNKFPVIYGSVTQYAKPLTYLNIVCSDAWAHCGARRFASRFSSYGLPSYLYTYNYMMPITPPCFGVTHAAELPMFFPSVSFFYLIYNSSSLERQLSTNMMLYWANFIHKSNPNYVGSPANWEAYHISSDGDFVLDTTPQMRYYYKESTCSRFWNQYAIWNSTGTSSGIRNNGKSNLFTLFFVLFVLTLI